MAMGTNLIRLMRRHVGSLRAMPDSPQKQQITKIGLLDKVEDKSFEKGKGLIEVDGLMVVNLGGSYAPHGPFPFAKAEDYYAWAGSHHVLPTVKGKRLLRRLGLLCLTSL